MGAFEDSIPEKLKQVEQQIEKHTRDKWNIDWGHECDCDYSVIVNRQKI